MSWSVTWGHGGKELPHPSTKFFSGRVENFRLYRGGPKGKEPLIYRIRLFIMKLFGLKWRGECYINDDGVG